MATLKEAKRNVSGWDYYDADYEPGPVAADPVFSGKVGGSTKAINSQDAQSLMNIWDRPLTADQVTLAKAPKVTPGTVDVIPGSSQFHGLNAALSNDYGSGDYDYGSYGKLGSGVGAGAGASAKTQYKPPTGSTTTRVDRTTYSGTKPATTPRPELSLPAWGDENDRAVLARAQKISGSDTLAVKQALQQAAGQTYRNPLAASFTLSRALQAAGISLGNIREKAHTAAESAERSEFMDERSRLMAEHQDQVSKWSEEYQRLWNEYLSTATTTSTQTQKYMYGTSGGEGSTGAGADAGSGSSNLRSLSGGLAYGGESMATFINPKQNVGPRIFT